MNIKGKIYSIMQFLKKNLSTLSSDDNRDLLPRFTDRSENKTNKKPLNNFSLSRRLKNQTQVLTEKGVNGRKIPLKELYLQKTNLNFAFLSQNFQFMNRTLNMFSLRNYQKLLNINRLEILSNFKNSQIKYDKTRKQDWMTAHKRVPTNFGKFNDIQQRKMYRSRKKYFENSLSTFNPIQQKTKCFDGVFPMTRLNSTLATIYDRLLGKLRLFLIGGLSSQMSKTLHFHQYQFATNTWRRVDSQANGNPEFNLSQHIILSYQSNIYIIGGITVMPSSTQMKNQRYNIPFITCYNIKTKKWSRINWNTYLRAHAGACFGQYGIIDGGINQEDKISTKVYIMDLSKIQSPTLVSYNSIGLCHHKIISTELFEDKSRSVLKFDGLLCFGGKKDNGQLNKNLYLMNFDSRNTDLIDKFNKFQWNILQTSGKSPEPRYMHSMDLLQTKSSIFERKAYCAVLGGIDQNQNILRDFWLFDLTTLQWSQIILAHSQCLILQKGIAGHCTASTKNQLFIFGGYNEERYNISKFWTINCENNFRIGKKQANKSSKQQQ